MAKAGDRFHVLPGVDEPASDELVFASDDWLKDNEEQADIIVEELLKLWREMKANPTIIEDERAKRNLIADQPKEVLDEVVPFYTEAVEGRRLRSRSRTARRWRESDFEFYTEAGQMKAAGRLQGRGFLGPRAARGRQEGAGGLSCVEFGQA